MSKLNKVTFYKGHYGYTCTTNSVNAILMLVKCKVIHQKHLSGQSLEKIIYVYFHITTNLYLTGHPYLNLVVFIKIYLNTLHRYFSTCQLVEDIHELY